MTRQAARFLSISGYALNAQKTSHDSTQSGYDVVAEVDTMSCLQTPVGEGANAVTFDSSNTWHTALGT